MKSESFNILLQMDKLRHWNINGSILNLAWVIWSVQIQISVVFEETGAFKRDWAHGFTVLELMEVPKSSAVQNAQLKTNI